ncbi:MAG: MBL fold metallo-hydrolase [Desulfobacteraceae bacterium]|nr:MAG: MBL fold metallo-hydrolase [Desulfobacteraceae bacterium]
MRFSVIASGSSGNMVFCEAGSTRLIIDAGITARETEKRLTALGIKPSSIDGLIITHEHLDHVKGAGSLARRYDLPVFVNARTLDGMKAAGKLPKVLMIQTGVPFSAGEIKVNSFTKCHDAGDPIGLTLSFNGVRIGIATDLGLSTRLVEDRLKGCDALIVEFNHDEEMLESGPYPWFLKKRIRGREGHLSNTQAGGLVGEVSGDNLRYLVLAHLSKINNVPEKAMEAAKRALLERGRNKTSVLVAQESAPIPMVEIS